MPGIGEGAEPENTQRQDPLRKVGAARGLSGRSGAGGGEEELDAEVSSLTRVSFPHGAVTSRSCLCLPSSLSPLSVSLDIAPPEIWPLIPFEDLKACSEEGASRLNAH